MIRKFDLPVSRFELNFPTHDLASPVEGNAQQFTLCFLIDRYRFPTCCSIHLSHGEAGGAINPDCVGIITYSLRFPR